MSDRNYIIAPDKQAQIHLRVDPVLAVLHPLVMLPDVGNFTGLGERLYQIAKALDDNQIRQKQFVIFEAFGSIFFEFDEVKPWDYDDFLTYIDAICTYDGITLRQQLLDAMFRKAADHEIETPTEESLIADVGQYISLTHQLMKVWNQPAPDVTLLQATHHYIQNPEELPPLIQEHCRYMWDEYFEDEWNKTQHMLEETVNAFRQIDYTAMSTTEAIRTITGRDLSHLEKFDKILNASQITFTPVPYIGPYIGMFHGKRDSDEHIIVFRPHLPEGVTTQVPDLDRSELLVRLNALADETRLRILELFKDQDTWCAQDIIQVLDLSQSAASRHLRQLSATGYLYERRQEGAKCYTLNAERVITTLNAVKNYLAIFE